MIHEETPPPQKLWLIRLLRVDSVENLKLFVREGTLLRKLLENGLQKLLLPFREVFRGRFKSDEHSVDACVAFRVHRIPVGLRYVGEMRDR